MKYDRGKSKVNVLAVATQEYDNSALKPRQQEK